MQYKIEHGIEKHVLIVEAGTAQAAMVLANAYRTITAPIKITRTNHQKSDLCFIPEKSLSVQDHQILFTLFDLALKFNGFIKTDDDRILQAMANHGMTERFNGAWRLTEKGLQYACWHDNHVYLLRRLCQVSARSPLTVQFIHQRLNNPSIKEWLGGKRLEQILLVMKAVKLPALLTGYRYTQILGTLLDMETDNPKDILIELQKQLYPLSDR